MEESYLWGHFFCPMIGTYSYLIDFIFKNETISSMLKCPFFFVCWIPEFLCNFLNPIYYKYNFLGNIICKKKEVPINEVNLDEILVENF